MSEVIPDYKDHIKNIQSARQALEVDADSQRDREAFYHAAREHVTTLKGIWDLFDECEPELARARSKANRQILATWAALFGAIGGVGFVVLRVLGLA